MSFRIILAVLAAALAMPAAAQEETYVGDPPQLVSAHYQFAQACEWLYRDTKDPRFAATLLDWARGYQSIQPTVAWG